MILRAQILQYKKNLIIPSMNYFQSDVKFYGHKNETIHIVWTKKKNSFVKNFYK